MCTSMYMRGCEGWEEFCSSPLTAHAGVPGAAAAALCLKPDERGGIVAPPRPPTPPAPPVAEPPPPPSVACISSPASSGCESYVYPDSSALADVARLCASMPNMPGCSLQAACTVRGGGGWRAWCNAVHACMDVFDQSTHANTAIIKAQDPLLWCS